MKIKENQEIKDLLKDLQENMIDFIPKADYSKLDVENCINIIETFLEKIQSSTSKKDGMKSVQKAVIALNKLNESVNYTLIETMERETIAEIMIIAGSLKSYNDRDDDITEEWRDW